MTENEQLIQFILDTACKLKGLHNRESRTYQYLNNKLINAIQQIYGEGEKCECIFGDFGHQNPIF